MKLTRADRERHVAKMREYFLLEGFEPSDDDKRLQQQYIDGTKTLDELLEHANQFAKAHGLRGLV